MRAKMVFTLQVSATPFHQGLVALAAQYGSPSVNGTFYNRLNQPCTCTNVPHVILDLSSDTMVQLHLPFLYVAEYADVRNTGTDEVNYMNMTVTNLMTIPSVAGLGTPYYQVFLHLEDIEFYGATPNATSSIALTAGRKLSPVTEEFEKDSHPYSSALHAAGRAIGFIAKGVPSISSIGGPVAWALGKAAGVVRYFGYGKPAVQDPVMRVFRQATVGEFNTDVATASMVLAATAANTTSINTQVGASDVDEMSLSYITSRWSQIMLFNYDTTSTNGTLLYGTLINPLCFWFRNRPVPAFNKPVVLSAPANANAFQPSHLMFAASSFKQWRGGIKFRFTFAKTKMHAGRVMVTFNPYFSTRGETPFMSTAQTAIFPAYGVPGPDPFGYSAIFDLKDGNVFEFKVPYVAPVPYANLTSVTGALAMYVVDPLIASSVVSSSINVLVQVAGDTDFELANPAGLMFPVHNSGTITTQAGRVLSEAPELVNQLTMGEAITSVKQLIGIPHVTFNLGTAGTTTSVIIPPWYYQPTLSAIVPSVGGVLPKMTFSYGGNWASCYTFCKGGTDVHAYSMFKNSTFEINQSPAANAFINGSQAADSRSSTNAPIIFNTEPNIHARLPGFVPTTRTWTFMANITAVGNSFWSGNPYTTPNPTDAYKSVQALFGLNVQYTDAVQPQYIRMSTNAADDAQLAMYVGPPPCYLPPTPVVGGIRDPDT